MNASTNAFAALVTDATAWKGADFARDSSWMVTLGARQLAELQTAADACIARGVRETGITHRAWRTAPGAS